MIKKAGLEQSSLVDPKTGLKIRVSTTARIRYREYLKDNFPEKESLSNIVLNEILNSLENSIQTPQNQCENCTFIVIFVIRHQLSKRF